MSVYAGPEISNNGLVLYLDAGNTKSYSGSGSTWFDLSGNGYNGTLTNGVVYNNGTMVFDGVDDRIQGQTYTSNITNKTLSGWVKLSTLNQGGGGLINFQISDGSKFDAIVYNETSNGWGFGSDSYSRTGWSGVLETSTTQWINMVATYENLNYRMYRNGVLIYTLTSFNVFNFNVLCNNLIGYRHTGGSSAFLAGSIAQASFYNRALTAAEIKQNFNALRGRFGI